MSYLARQPIFDMDDMVVAYELFCRGEYDAVPDRDGDPVPVGVFLENCIEIGLKHLVDGYHLFIRAPYDFILQHEALPPGNDRLVLEIPGNIDVDEDFIEAVRALSAKNYQIAIDEYEDNQGSSELLGLAQIVKIDIPRHNVGELSRLVNSLQGKTVKLLAKNVERVSQYDHCRRMGFDYFQGSYYLEPRTEHGRRLLTSKLQVMQLLTELQNQDAESMKLERIIEKDAVLSRRLLHYINSSAFPMKGEIESIRHAINVIGNDGMTKWASMIVLSKIEGKSAELIGITLLRAKMCEALTHDSGLGNPDSAFMVGLFSTLDALMDIPLIELLSMLPITNEIREALLYHRGPYNRVLACVLAYEQGDWKSIDEAGFIENEVVSCYFQAVEWSEESCAQMLEKSA